MLGSVHDAEDALQDALLRAWRALAPLRGPQLAARLALHDRHEHVPRTRSRGARSGCSRSTTAPSREPDDGPGVPLVETVWIEPYPDEQLGLEDGSPRPRPATSGARASSSRSSPRSSTCRRNQRAALILREVLGFSAQEVAERSRRPSPRSTARSSARARRSTRAARAEPAGDPARARRRAAASDVVEATWTRCARRRGRGRRAARRGRHLVDAAAGQPGTPATTRCAVPARAAVGRVALEPPADHCQRPGRDRRVRVGRRGGRLPAVRARRADAERRPDPRGHLVHRPLDDSEDPDFYQDYPDQPLDAAQVAGTFAALGLPGAARHVGPHDVRLPPPLAERLAERARALLPLGTVLEDAHAPRRGGGGARRARRAAAEHVPYPDPRYAGQMLKPPAALAWAAYATAMLLNPNNHALDGGPATAEMEKEAVEQLAAMFGLPQHLGHLTASGTIANLEALWVARELHPDAAIVSGANAHYTHARVSAVLGARHETVPEDADGRLDLDALAARLARGGVGTVVATPGTTGARRASTTSRRSPTCAPSTARGCTSTPPTAASSRCSPTAARPASPPRRSRPSPAPTRSSSTRTSTACSPTAAAACCSPTPASGRLYAHDSPYTYFTSDELHLGEISLECSRAGAAAAALWTTLRALPLTRAGLGRHVGRGARGRARDRRGARRRPAHDAWCVEPELDIVCVLPAGALGRRGERRVRAGVRHARRGRLARREAARRDGLAAAHGIRSVAADAPTPPPSCAAACSSRSTRASPASWRRRSPATSTRRGRRMKRPFRQVDVFTHDALPRATRSRSCSTAQGLSTEADAALRALDEPVRDDVRPAAEDPAADYRVRIFTPVARAAVRRPPDARHVPRVAGARRQRPPAASSAGVRRRAGPGPRGRSTGLAFAAPPLLRDGPVEEALAERVAAALGLERAAIADRRVGRQRPGLGRRAARQRRGGARRCGRGFVDLDIGVVGPHPPGGPRSPARCGPSSPRTAPWSRTRSPAA